MFDVDNNTKKNKKEKKESKFGAVGLESRQVLSSCYRFFLGIIFTYLSIYFRL